MRVQEVRGLVLVNPATSYERSNLARFGPICAGLQGPLLYPLYILSLLGFAALVLTPTYQAPAFISMLAATKIPTLLNNPYREAWLGRVALGAQRGTVRASKKGLFIRNTKTALRYYHHLQCMYLAVHPSADGF